MAYLDRYSISYLPLETNLSDIGTTPISWSGAGTFQSSWYKLNGTGSVITGSPTLGGQDYTIDFRMKVTSIEQNTREIFRCNNIHFRLINGVLTNIPLSLNDNNLDLYDFSKNNTCHVAVVYTHSNTTHTIYINGQRKMSTTRISVSKGSKTLELGNTENANIFFQHLHISDGTARWSENFSAPTSWNIPVGTPTIYYNTYDGNKLKISTQEEKDGPAVPVYFNGRIYYVHIVGADDNPSKIRIRYNNQNLYLQSEQTYQELLALPKLSFLSKAYNNGASISPPTYTTYDTSQVQISGTGLSAQKNVGKYPIKFTILDTKKLGWSGVDGATYTATWEITKQPIAVPDLETEFTYNKASQGPEVSSTIYKLTNNKQTDAGEYTATLSFVNTNFYMWKDTKVSTPRDISYTINKKSYTGTAELTVNLTDYNSKLKTFMTSTNGTFGRYDPVTKLKTNDVFTTATITEKCFNGSSNDIILTCGGELSTDIITMDPSKSNISPASQPVFLHAGTYYIARSLVDKNNTTATITNENVTLSGVETKLNSIIIQPLRILALLQHSEAVWEFTYEKGVSRVPYLKEGSFFSKIMTLSATEREAAGESSLTLTIKSTYKNDIKWVNPSTKADIDSASCSFTWKINKLSLPVPKQSGECPYTTEQCTPTWNSDFNSDYMQVVSYTASGENSERKDPGTYHATIQLTDNSVQYSDGTRENKVVEWKIAGQAVAPPKFEYDHYVFYGGTADAPAVETYRDKFRLTSYDGINIDSFYVKLDTIHYVVSLKDSTSKWTDGYSEASRDISAKIHKTALRIELRDYQESDQDFPLSSEGAQDPPVYKDSFGNGVAFKKLRFTYSFKTGITDLDNILKRADPSKVEFTVKKTASNIDGKAYNIKIDKHGSTSNYKVPSYQVCWSWGTVHSHFYNGATLQVSIADLPIEDYLFIGRTNTFTFKGYVPDLSRVKAYVINKAGKMIVYDPIRVETSEDVEIRSKIYFLINTEDRPDKNHQIRILYNRYGDKPDEFTSAYEDIVREKTGGNFTIDRLYAWPTDDGFYSITCSKGSGNDISSGSGVYDYFGVQLDITTTSSVNAKAQNITFSLLHFPVTNVNANIFISYGNAPDLSKNDYSPILHNSDLFKVIDSWVNTKYDKAYFFTAAKWDNCNPADHPYSITFEYPASDTQEHNVTSELWYHYPNGTEVKVPATKIYNSGISPESKDGTIVFSLVSAGYDSSQDRYYNGSQLKYENKIWWGYIPQDDTTATTLLNDTYGMTDDILYRRMKLTADASKEIAEKESDTIIHRVHREQWMSRLQFRIYCPIDTECKVVETDPITVKQSNRPKNDSDGDETLAKDAHGWVSLNIKKQKG